MANKGSSLGSLGYTHTYLNEMVWIEYLFWEMNSSCVHIFKKSSHISVKTTEKVNNKAAENIKLKIVVLIHY